MVSNEKWEHNLEFTHNVKKHLSTYLITVSYDVLIRQWFFPSHSSPDQVKSHVLSHEGGQAFWNDLLQTLDVKVRGERADQSDIVVPVISVIKIRMNKISRCTNFSRQDTFYYYY